MKRIAFLLVTISLFGALLGCSSEHQQEPPLATTIDCQSKKSPADVEGAACRILKLSESGALQRVVSVDEALQLASAFERFNVAREALQRGEITTEAYQVDYQATLDVCAAVLGMTCSEAMKLPYPGEAL